MNLIINDNRNLINFKICIFAKQFIQMTVITEQITPTKTRLKFIDLARSIAILLMLEGHFIDDSLILGFRNTLPANAIPTTVVIDQQGRAAARISGPITVADRAPTAIVLLCGSIM